MSKNLILMIGFMVAILAVTVWGIAKLSGVGKFSEGDLYRMCAEKAEGNYTSISVASFASAKAKEGYSYFSGNGRVTITLLESLCFYGDDCTEYFRPCTLYREGSGWRVR